VQSQTIGSEQAIMPQAHRACGMIACSPKFLGGPSLRKSMTYMLQQLNRNNCVLCAKFNKERKADFADPSIEI